MATSVIIVGGGKVGTSLASLLLGKGHKVKVIEAQQEEIPRLQKDLPPEVVVLGSGTDPNVLEAAGVRGTNVVAAVTGQDETNLVVTSLARFEFYVPRTVARVNNPKNAWMFTPIMGVDVALDQPDLMAHLIAEEMSLSEVMTLFKLRQRQYLLMEQRIQAPAMAIGKAVRDLDLPAECVLISVMRKGQVFTPRGETVLEAGDEVLAVVHATQQEKLKTLLGSAKRA
ncbi:MAG: TrkA family potassium uptake protein [Chloroflexi bacterium]|nr:TrkA family potassium uptake protein [Chloroflexota bacterium]